MDWAQLLGTVAWGTLLEHLEKIVQVLATLVGGIWVYMNFSKGRTYQSRLQSELSGRIVTDHGNGYLIVSLQIKNAGLSKICFKQAGTGLRILSHNPSELMTGAAGYQWQHFSTEEILADHQWIEPGETIQEEIMIGPISEKLLALRIELRVVSGKTAWKTIKVVERCPERAREARSTLDTQKGSQ